MRAVVLRETGPADNLRLEDIATPQPGPGQVRVRVRAAGVCHRDVIDRKGGFPFMKKPVIPGHEFGGEVDAVGDGVSALAVGDRVVNLHRAPCGTCAFCRAGHEPNCQRSLAMFGLTIDGGYAEHVVADAGSLVRLPDAIAYERGCFLACTAGIALRALRARAELQPGQRVLVTGASGGVGLHGLQVARALGAHVIAVTSSPAKAETLRAHGAHEVVVSADGRFNKQVKAVHVVLECVGAPTLEASIRSLLPMGRVVVAGNVTVERAAINPGYFILNEVGVLGTHGCTSRDLQQLFEWVHAGALVPVLDGTLPLARAADAHRRLEAKSVTGRLVLVP
jgi:D-arabinose 1-dehydrogenase-like Zn-dependent alcohol dehydrogenase